MASRDDGFGFACAAAQHGRDPGQHLVEAERLGDVVVAAETQPGDPVVRGVAGGQEDHGDAGPAVVDSADHLEAVAAGHHHIQQDQVRLARCGGAQRFGAGGRGEHVEAGEP